MEPIGRRLRASSDANSGHSVEYALTSRTFFFQPDDFARGISPTGRSMAEDEAPMRSFCAEHPHGGSQAISLHQKSRKAMTNIEQDRWSRVKGRLRSSVGEDVYSSWFARMDLEGVQDESVRLSVPTRFLKSWIQAHYAERVLT